MLNSSLIAFISVDFLEGQVAFSRTRSITLFYMPIGSEYYDMCYIIEKKREYCTT